MTSITNIATCKLQHHTRPCRCQWMLSTAINLANGVVIFILQATDPYKAAHNLDKVLLYLLIHTRDSLMQMFDEWKSFDGLSLPVVMGSTPGRMTQHFLMSAEAALLSFSWCRSWCQTKVEFFWIWFFCLWRHFLIDGVCWWKKNKQIDTMIQIVTMVQTENRI